MALIGPVQGTIEVFGVTIFTARYHVFPWAIKLSVLLNATPVDAKSDLHGCWAPPLIEVCGKHPPQKRAATMVKYRGVPATETLWVLWEFAWKSASKIDVKSTRTTAYTCALASTMRHPKEPHYDSPRHNEEIDRFSSSCPVRIEHIDRARIHRGHVGSHQPSPIRGNGETPSD